MSVMIIDEFGNQVGKVLSAFPDIDPGKNLRVSYASFMTTAVEIGTGKILKHGSAEAELIHSGHPKGYSVRIVGKKVADVKFLLKSIQKTFGYTEEYVMPFGIVFEKSNLLQRFLWLFTGKKPE